MACKPSHLVCTGLFMSNLVFLFVLFAICPPLYIVEGCDDTGVLISHGLFSTCISSYHSHACMGFSDLQKRRNAGSFKVNWRLTIATLFTSAIVGIAIFFLGCFHYCRKIDLARGTFWIVIMTLSAIHLVCAIVTAAVPTYELVEEQDKVSSTSMRTLSFWYMLLWDLAAENFFLPSETESIVKSLQTKNITIEHGWVLIVIWMAPVWGILAIVCFYLSAFVKDPQKTSSPDESTSVLSSESSDR